MPCLPTRHVLRLQLKNGKYRPVELPGNAALKDFAVVLTKEGHPLPPHEFYMEMPKSSM